ncbi:F-box only protein 9 [Rhynchophorus ferrugineus]|uniref:F-box only protein 9 n=1 Tax=Rhynchophorus ferrugineus TaxID=354439 RepID=A0A834MHJ5_RHYFE|nr:hypothetical protein GWI33_002641 [Rhynchophorus ferrugineus]
MDNIQLNNENGSSGNDEEGEEQDDPSSSLGVEEELANFREKWHKELRSQPVVRSISKKVDNSTSLNEDSDEVKARALFLQGIDMEKSGKLYEAIQYYRKAVQIVPDIESKLDYRPKHNINEIPPETIEENQETDDSNDDSDDNEIIEEKQLLPRIQRKVSKMRFLCTPKFEQTSTHISSIPVEILLYILRWVVSTDLDLRSLEMFGLVCRGFYLCARDAEIWRSTCQRIWGLNCGPSPGLYGTWRNMFIERSRLNFNGCYISKTTYIRHGENNFQDQFYRPWHVVAYYRYLRFFPEGMVLMLMSPDEPSQCVPQMKSRCPRYPVMIGYYRLKDDKVTLVVQRSDTSKNLQSALYRKGTKKRDAECSEQTLHMELEIKSHKNKRHFKLVWTYYSIFTKSNQGQESTCTFDLIANKYPPLLFSRVKSFTSESDQPLN